MLLDRDAIARAIDGLRPEDFYRDAHRVIFTAVLNLVEHGKPVDLITVTNRLAGMGKLDDTGGASYIASLPNVVPSAANIDHYVGIVRERRERRDLLAAGQILQHGAMNGQDSAASVAAVQALLRDVEHRRVWPEADGEAVPGETLLRDVGAFLQRFVRFLSTHQVTAVSLWVLHTHAIDAAEATPYLAITSAEKQSGKTRALEVLELLVRRPWCTIRPSEPVLFRTIAAECPSLLLDEVDTIFRDKVGTFEGHRALLNAGHRRGATVARCVNDGKTIKLERFQVFCAKALAGIGELPDTVADRSIPIRLKPRRRDTEPVERFRPREVAVEAVHLRAALTRWAEEHLDVLRGARPEIPASISDRAADGWEPLLAIADLAGGDWPQTAQEAAIALHSDPLAQEDTLGVQLLRAIRETFETAAAHRLATADLLSALVTREDGPWAEWWGEAVAKGNTQGPGSRLARLLRPYRIISRDIRTDNGTLKGYMRSDFEDAFTRYAPSPPPESRDTATSLDKKGPEANSKPRHEEVCRGSEVPAKPCPASDIAASRPRTAKEGRDEGNATPEDPLVAYARGVFGTEVVEVRPAPWMGPGS